jgi:exosortase/archaeosortase family protein
VRIDIVVFTKKNSEKIILLAPLAAFAVPLLWMYLLNPASFDALWKGRTFQLFFVWLILLELILGWETLQKGKMNKPNRMKLAALLIALLLPTIYVMVSNYFGLNSAIVESSKQSGIYWYNDMPAAVEYLVFAGFFSLMAFLILELRGLKNFSIPILFSVIIGAVFIIDSVYPNGQFTPFQFLVPTTTMLASNILGFMGYHTTLDLSQGNLPQLTVTDPSNPLKTASFGIAWPCAGIESLLIFAVTIMLFLKRMPISWQAKIGYFAFGAGVTYLINILRIVSIYLFAIGGGDVNVFHQNIGPLYPIAWIVSYPLIILGSQSLWHRITSKKKDAFTSPEATASDAQKSV